jgi:hypothetical protein
MTAELSFSCRIRWADFCGIWSPVGADLGYQIQPTLQQKNL